MRSRDEHSSGLDEWIYSKCSEKLKTVECCGWVGLKNSQESSSSSLFWYSYLDLLWLYSTLHLVWFPSGFSFFFCSFWRPEHQHQPKPRRDFSSILFISSQFISKGGFKSSALNSINWSSTLLGLCTAVQYSTSPTPPTPADPSTNHPPSPQLAYTVVHHCTVRQQIPPPPDGYPLAHPHVNPTLEIINCDHTVTYSPQKAYCTYWTAAQCYRIHSEIKIRTILITYSGLKPTYVTLDPVCLDGRHPWRVWITCKSTVLFPSRLWSSPRLLKSWSSRYSKLCTVSIDFTSSNLIISTLTWRSFICFNSTLNAFSHLITNHTIKHLTVWSFRYPIFYHWHISKFITSLLTVVSVMDSDSGIGYI